MSLFEINATRPEKEQSEYKITAYTIKGNSNITDDDGVPLVENVANLAEAIVHPDVYAVKIENRYRTEYYVMATRNGYVFNPFSMYEYGYKRKPSEKNPLRSSEYSLQKVNQRCFDQYLLFLKTRHEQFISRAQRETVA